MDVNSLKIFAAVAAEASVTRAAQRLDYVQSNVTARIKQLEQELGTPLFYRHTRGMLLTPAGKTLLGYTERVLCLLDEAREAVRASGVMSRELGLGATEINAAVRLPPLLVSYHQENPQVDLVLSVATSGELVKAVLAYQLDGAFVQGPIEHPDLEAEVAFVEELVLVTAAGVPGLDALRSRVALVFCQGCGYRERLERMLREHDARPYRLMEFGTLDGILNCVVAGMGVTVLPRCVIQGLGYAGRVTLHQLPPDLTDAPTVFVRRRDTLRTSAVDALLALLQTADKNAGGEN
jgi:LysR family transcriptional regulator, cell division regulator